MTEEPPAELSGSLLARKGSATPTGFGDAPASLRHSRKLKLAFTAGLWLFSFAILTLSTTLALTWWFDDVDAPVAGNSVVAELKMLDAQKSQKSGTATKISPVAVALATPTPPVPIVVSSGKPVFRVQLHALRSSSAARQEWRKLQGAHGDLFKGLTMMVERAGGADQNNLYRLQAGPVETRHAARQLCRQAKRRRLDCVVIEP